MTLKVSFSELGWSLSAMPAQPVPGSLGDLSQVLLGPVPSSTGGGYSGISSWSTVLISSEFPLSRE